MNTWTVIFLERLYYRTKNTWRISFLLGISNTGKKYTIQFKELELKIISCCFKFCFIFDHNYLPFLFLSQIYSFYFWFSLLQYFQSLTPHVFTTHSNMTLSPRKHLVNHCHSSYQISHNLLTLTYKSLLFYYPFFYNLTSLSLHLKTFTFIPPGCERSRLKLWKRMAKIDWRWNQAFTTMRILFQMVLKAGFTRKIVNQVLINMSVSLQVYSHK